MIKNKWNKRYTFRLTQEDEDIYQFLESSKQSNSETIRQLLKFALNQIDKEQTKQQMNQQHADLLNEINTLREQQNQRFEEILDKLNSSIVTRQQGESIHEDVSNEQEKVNKSMENSIDSMLSSFGME